MAARRECCGSPIMRIAGSVADILVFTGYAPIDDEMIEPLADLLTEFLRAAGITVDEAAAAAYYRDVSTYVARSAFSPAEVTRSGSGRPPA